MHFAHTGHILTTAAYFVPVVGFLAQAPMGTTCDARFDAIRFTDVAPEDLRDGS